MSLTLVSLSTCRNARGICPCLWLLFDIFVPPQAAAQDHSSSRSLNLSPAYFRIMDQANMPPVKSALPSLAKAVEAL